MNKWGMVAHASGQPREALSWVEAGQTFDIALLDLDMPDLNGISLSREMRRAHASLPTRFVLLSSAHPRLADTETDFDAVLSKPIRQEALFDALVGVLHIKPVDTVDLVAGKRENVFDAGLGKRRPLRILLVDDNTMNQRVAGRMLGKFGYVPVLACSGAEAITAVSEKIFDVILMDVEMPDMDGLEVARRIRARRDLPVQPRIIAMTANATTEDRAHCLAAGMDDYLAKPVRPADLEAAIKRCPPLHVPGD
jgi:CheY-like chemotaxis protein